MVSRHPLSTSRLRAAILSGYRVTSGGYAEGLTELRSAGLIDGSPTMIPTEAGLAREGTPKPLPTRAMLLDAWMDRIETCPAAILQCLADAYPDAVARDVLAQRAGYRVTSGGYSEGLMRLRRLGLMQDWVAAPELMDPTAPDSDGR